MKKIIFFPAFLLAAGLLAAEPSFSGLFAGSAGVDTVFYLDGKKPDLKIPFGGFAAAQVDFTDWATARAEVELRAKDFDFEDLFTEGEASIKVHEISLVLNNRAVTSTGFFSAFFGSYEPIGSDTFLMRHFGIDPFSSKLAKSSTTLSGTELYSTTGGGISYVMRFDKHPSATGGYLYFSKDDEDNLTANFDWRYAFVTNLVSMDVSLGIADPMQNKPTSDSLDFFDLDTLSLHGGLNMLLGSKYTHSLLLQAGVANFDIRGESKFELSGDNLCLFVEPRLRFSRFNLNFTAYALKKDTIDSLVYLRDQVGAAVTVYNDSIYTSRGAITAGIHLIFSLGNTCIMDLMKGKNTDSIKYDAFITPYAEFPLSNTSTVELMAQVGVLDLTDSPAIAFKVVAGFSQKF